ncbi:unnamed protein product, partial [Ectocarpus sp. 12 AP-2014]
HSRACRSRWTIDLAFLQSRDGARRVPTGPGSHTTKREAPSGIRRVVWRVRCILLRLFAILCLLPCVRMTAANDLIYFLVLFTCRDSCKHCVTASRVLDQFNTTCCDHSLCARGRGRQSLRVRNNTSQRRLEAATLVSRAEC